MNVETRFLNYVHFDTESSPDSSTAPSTLKQLELGKFLVQEMNELHLDQVHLDATGTAYGIIPSNCGNHGDKIGFIAHMDTSPDASGANIHPRIIKDYDGKIITLNEEKRVYLDPEEFPSLLENVHHDLIVTDGTTLLGGDDKAGIAEIMSMAEYLIEHPEIKHNDIYIAFTPDEEVGRGTENFDFDFFKADYAYTVDGGEVNAIDYENFHAASGSVTIHGQSIHPGSAKGKMLNSLLVAMEFEQLLPIQDHPFLTEGYEGFNHLVTMEGNCEETRMEYIIRNHDKTLLEKQKRDFENARDFLNRKYGDHTVSLVIEDTYANMRTIIEKDMRVIEKAQAAMKDIGLVPTSHAIRGGTDGANLTYRGLPCPNLGTGGYNCHGKHEYVDIYFMNQSVQLLIKIVEKSV